MDEGLKIAFEFAGPVGHALSGRVCREWRKLSVLESGWRKAYEGRWWHREEKESVPQWRALFIKKITMEALIAHTVLVIEDKCLCCAKLEALVYRATEEGIDLREYLVSLAAVFGDDYSIDQFNPPDLVHPFFRKAPDEKNLKDFLIVPCPALGPHLIVNKERAELVSTILCAAVAQRKPQYFQSCHPNNRQEENAFLGLVEIFSVFCETEAVYRELDRLADIARQRSIKMTSLHHMERQEKCRALEWVLFDEKSPEKFRGNVKNYYDKRNSLLDFVLATKLGIPISLAVVFIAVARRLGLDGFYMVNAPGHVYVYDEVEETYLDVFLIQGVSSHLTRLSVEQVMNKISAHARIANFQALFTLDKPPVHEMLARSLRNLEMIIRSRTPSESKVHLFLLQFLQSLVIEHNSDPKNCPYDHVESANRCVQGCVLRIAALNGLATKAGLKPSLLLARTMYENAVALRSMTTCTIKLLSLEHLSASQYCDQNVSDVLNLVRTKLGPVLEEHDDLEFFKSSEINSFLDA